MKVPGTCSAALLYQSGKWSALNTPSLSSAVRKSLKAGEITETAMTQKHMRWPHWFASWPEHLLVCELIRNHKQVNPGQARPGAEVGDLHAFVRVPVRFHKDAQPQGFDRNQASDSQYVQSHEKHRKRRTRTCWARDWSSRPPEEPSPRRQKEPPEQALCRLRR